MGSCLSACGLLRGTSLLEFVALPSQPILQSIHLQFPGCVRGGLPPGYGRRWLRYRGAARHGGRGITFWLTSADLSRGASPARFGVSACHTTCPGGGGTRHSPPPTPALGAKRHTGRRHERLWAGARGACSRKAHLLQFQAVGLFPLQRSRQAHILPPRRKRSITAHVPCSSGNLSQIPT